MQIVLAVYVLLSQGLKVPLASQSTEKQEQAQIVDSRPPVPLIVGQLNTGSGKTVILQVMALLVRRLHPELKVVMYSPTP